jgi:hypothetical protein
MQSLRDRARAESDTPYRRLIAPKLEAWRNEMADWLSEQQEVVAACMAVAGFEYEPRDVITPSFDVVPSIDPVSDAAAVGYGLSSEAYPFWELRPDPTNVIPAAPYLAAEDPNDAIVAALTPRDAAAYWLAYTGGGTRVGCGVLLHEEYPTQPFALLQASLLLEFSELERAISDDPRIDDADAGWRACMAAFGLPFEHPSEPGSEAFANAQALYGTSSPEELERRSAEVEARERQLATADAECSIERRRIQLEVRIHHEQNFVDEYGDRILELLTDPEPPTA